MLYRVLFISNTCACFTGCFLVIYKTTHQDILAKRWSWQGGKQRSLQRYRKIPQNKCSLEQIPFLKMLLYFMQALRIWAQHSACSKWKTKEDGAVDTERRLLLALLPPSASTLVPQLMDDDTCACSLQSRLMSATCGGSCHSEPFLHCLLGEHSFQIINFKS